MDQQVHLSGRVAEYAVWDYIFGVELGVDVAQGGVQDDEDGLEGEGVAVGVEFQD